MRVRARSGPVAGDHEPSSRLGNRLGTRLGTRLGSGAQCSGLGPVNAARLRMRGCAGAHPRDPAADEGPGATDAGALRESEESGGIRPSSRLQECEQGDRGQILAFRGRIWPGATARTNALLRRSNTTRLKPSRRGTELFMSSQTCQDNLVRGRAFAWDWRIGIGVCVTPSPS